MKIHTFLCSLMILISSVTFAQKSTGVSNAVATPQVVTNPPRFVSCGVIPTADFVVVIKDSIKWETYNINGLHDTIVNIGDANYKSIDYVPDWVDITGKPSFATVATTGDYNDLINKPTIPAAQVNSDWNAVSGPQQILNKPVIPAAQVASDYTQTNTAALDYIKNKPYEHTVAVAGGAGNAVFYITSDKTSTGTALYSTIDYVNPIINDSTINYSYGWSYNTGTKALTVNAKNSLGLNIALLGLTLLGTPSNVANGTNVFVYVKGH